MSFWQPSSTLSDVWDLLFEEPYPTLSVVIQSWMCGLRSSSLPLRCPVWQFHPGGQPRGGLQFSPQHKYMRMHAISNAMIISCMPFWQQSSTLSDVWDLRNLILLWALSFNVVCAAWGHPFLVDVWFGNFTKAGNLPVVRRRLQVSPQYNDMCKHAQRFFGCDHCRLTCQGIVLASHGNEMCF